MPVFNGGITSISNDNSLVQVLNTDARMGWPYPGIHRPGNVTSTSTSSGTSSFQFSLNFSFSTNSMYIPIMAGIG